MHISGEVKPAFEPVRESLSAARDKTRSFVSMSVKSGLLISGPALAPMISLRIR